MDSDMAFEAGPSSAAAVAGSSKLGGRQGEEGSTRASCAAKGKEKAKEERQPVPFEYFISLLRCIAAINHVDWPYRSDSPAIDRKYRKWLGRQEAKPGKSSSKERLAIRKEAVREATRDWIQKLPAGQGPGPQACLPGTTEAVFRLLFPEEDVRRRFRIKESTMIKHLSRAVNDDQATAALQAWNKSTAARKLTTGSGCLAIEFIHQLERLGHEDNHSVSSDGEGASKQSGTAEEVWGPLTLQQVDILLDELAAGCSFTDEAIRACWDISDETEVKEDQTFSKRGNETGPKPSRQRKQRNVHDPNRAGKPRSLCHAAKEGSTLLSRLAPSFQVPSDRPSRTARRKARPQNQILDYLLGPAVLLQSRAFLIQIILKDLDPMLYPLPRKEATSKVLDADVVLSEHNTRSVYKLTPYTAMCLWHPAMPDLWRVRYGSSFEAIGREIERLWWSSSEPGRPLLLGQDTPMVLASEPALPEIFTFVQMPKSLKAASCVEAAAIFDHAGVVWAEQKYDGERYQVHVKFSDTDEQPELRIFSKSQRDSTLDRAQTHGIVLAALGRDPNLARHPFNSQLLRSDTGVQLPRRRVSHSVILEAEMVAFDADGELAEFHKIAKIKDRAGWPNKEKENTVERQQNLDRRSASGPVPSMEERFCNKLKSAQLKRQAREQRDKARQEQHKKLKLASYTSESESDRSEDEAGGSFTSLPDVSQISDLTVNGSFHLGLVFFDVLHIDGESLIAKSYDYRRTVLESIIKPIPSFVVLAERTKLDFGPLSHAQQRRRMVLEEYEGKAAAQQLQSVLKDDKYWKEGMKALIGAFARSHARREEGLMLKAADGPYIGGLPSSDLFTSNPYVQPWLRDSALLWQDDPTEGYQHRGAWVKLKADYIDGLGDSVDMAVVGAGWSMKRARELRVGTDGFTTFFLAARLPDADGKARLRCWSQAEYGINRTELVRIISSVQNDDLETVEFNSKNLQNLPYHLELAQSGCQPTVLFPEPMIAEVMGGGFAKNAGDEFYMLRWPRIKKFFSGPDRTWHHAIDFDEMQRSAIKAARKLESEAEMQAAFEARASKLTDHKHLEWVREEIKVGKGPLSWKDGCRKKDGKDDLPSAKKKRKVIRFADEEPAMAVTIPKQVLTEARQSGFSVPPHAQHLVSDDSLAGALDREKQEEQRRIASGLGKKIRALQHRGVVRQLPQTPEDAAGPASRGKAVEIVEAGPPRPPSPPTSSPMRSGTLVAAVDRFSAPSVIWDLGVPQPLSSPIMRPVEEDLPVPVITPPSSGQPAAAPKQEDALIAPSTSNVVPPSPPTPSASSPQIDPVAPKPRTCASSPRLLDAAIYFHCNVPKESVDLLSGMLLKNLLVHSMEALVDSLIPVQASAQRGGQSGVPGQPRLTRSRSFQMLSGTTVEERQRCGIVIMDASDQEARRHMHEEIRQRVRLFKRRLAPSLSAPSGLSIQGSSKSTTANRANSELRRCLSATNASLARDPIILIDIKAVDRLVYEQWDCVEKCSAQGPAAAAGDCECCPHIDLVLMAMGEQDLLRMPNRTMPAARVSDRCWAATSNR
ncbi:hypothetical protein A4X09_0g5152 [Tilletia walkeri]|uniref:ATP-dependent DNA ligase family profile domain-containing protein n=1 Tax=Tilletia walkeri TaxID=117179 RepID=A0A8X7T3W6_9BASI|nr:hypothetical protein A4X09_0g5152 [Tilletia walkeri]